VWFKKVFFLVLFVFVITVLRYYGDKDKKKPAEIVLEKNNIGFTGHIISYNRSMDRAFGVIKFKVLTLNKETFNISDPRWLSLQIRKGLWRVLWLYTFGNYGRSADKVKCGRKKCQIIMER